MSQSDKRGSVLEGIIISTSHSSELVVARQLGTSYVMLTIGHREAVLSIAEARRLAAGLRQAARRQEAQSAG